MSARRAVAGIILLACGTSAGCAGGRTPVPFADVAGRGLQPAWWRSMPVVVPEGTDRPVGLRGDPPADPAAALVIPADTLFESGSAEIRHADLPRLAFFAEDLAPIVGAGGGWVVVGATDSDGEGAANDRLGSARAVAVIDVLRSHGVNSARLVPATWGEDCPAVDEATAPDLPQARAQNRRVVLIPPGITPTCPIH